MKTKTNREMVDMALDIIDKYPGKESSVLCELSEALDDGELKSFLVLLEKKASEAHKELVRDFRDYSEIVKILKSLQKVIKEKRPQNTGIDRKLFGELMEVYEWRFRIDESTSAWSRLQRWEKEKKFLFLTKFICDIWSIAVRFKYNRFY